MAVRSVSTKPSPVKIVLRAVKAAVAVVGAAAAIAVVTAVIVATVKAAIPSVARAATVSVADQPGPARRSPCISTALPGCTIPGKAVFLFRFHSRFAFD